MTREQVAEWVERYERAWRTAGTDTLRDLFAADATYAMGPYDMPMTGLARIGRLWEAEREGPDEHFTMTTEILAVEGDTAVARVEVLYGDPAEREYRDLWIIRFGADGRCKSFEEWPFWPERPSHAPNRPD